MSVPNWVVRPSGKEVYEYLLLNPNMDKYEAEARILIDKVVLDEPSRPYYKKYRTYVRTLHWLRLRSEKVKSVGNICKKCGTNKKLQVHHIRYKNLVDVVLDDLEVLCEDCHNKHHKG